MSARALGTGGAASRHVARTPRARSSRASEHSDRLGAHAPGHRAFAEGDANARAAGFPARRARGESAARAARTGGSWGARIVLGADPGLDRASALVARYAAADLANDAPDGNDPERRGGAERTGMLPTHDFCFTLPWGLFIALGGLSGFLIAGSAKSLAFGGGFGALLMLLGVSSLRRWKRGLPSRFETAASLVITLALTVVMGKKWLAGASVVPSGVIAIAALFMDVFYVVNIVSGGNPPPADGVEGGVGAAGRKED